VKRKENEESGSDEFQIYPLGCPMNNDRKERRRWDAEKLRGTSSEAVHTRNEETCRLSKKEEDRPAP
jgi:hypothetical protein